MSTDVTDCCNKLTAELNKADDIVTELRRKANDPKPGNPRPILLLENLRQVHQVASEHLQRLREMLEGDVEVALIQVIDNGLHQVNMAIPRFAAKFEDS
jgi:hypothetical protein